MFRETKDLEALTYGLEDYFFEGAFRVLAELARVRVVAVWHQETRGRRLDHRGSAVCFPTQGLSDRGDSVRRIVKATLGYETGLLCMVNPTVQYTQRMLSEWWFLSVH